MATAPISDFVRRLTHGLAAEALADHSDHHLVERALAGQGPSALQAIVQRHGPMVYRVCWRALQHPQDAEDAFQATFLVLAKKLRTLRKHASLASWLHGVAHRVALKARAQAAARRRHERSASRPDTLPPEDVPWSELRLALDRELARLPDKWRLPLVLCYLEGRTQDESASLLGWSKSTLRRRLEEARTALGSRLRGSWPAALSAALLSDCLASAEPAPGLVWATVEAAAGVAAGKTATTAFSAPVVALTEGVLKTMYLSTRSAATAALFFIGLVAAGLGGLSYRAPATERAEARLEAQTEKKKAPAEDAREARLLVEKARELDVAKASHAQAEANLKVAQKRLLQAQSDYEEAQDRYEAARARGAAKKDTTVKGVLVKVSAKENSVRVEHWKEVKEDGRSSRVYNFMAYEDFPVAKDALIVQDNVKTKLADLKNGARITLNFKGKSIVRVTANGGTVPGPVRFVSANAARNTIAVVAGRRDERRTYHLVKETEVTTAKGKVARVRDLKVGTMLLLTRSVEDDNTVIRIEALLP